MTEATEVSIVVCTYNRATMLRRALESLLCQKLPPDVPYEIVVIDDGSTDSTREVVASVARDSGAVPVRYFHQEGRGIAEARNHGVRRAQGNWIAFFDDDQWVDESWLRAHYRVVTETGADCTGGSMVLEFPQGEAQEQITPLSRVLLDERLPGPTATPCPHNASPATANAMIRRATLERLGGFDARIVEGVEDSDFFWKARANGASIWLAPQALVHHVIPQERLSDEYLTYVASRAGLCAARVRWKYVGCLRWFLALLRCGARSATLDTWMYLWGALARSPFLQRDAKCRWMMTCGYVRGSLMILAPNLFPQKAFRDRVNFRKQH